MATRMAVAMRSNAKRGVVIPSGQRGRCARLLYANCDLLSCMQITFSGEQNLCLLTQKLLRRRLTTKYHVTGHSFKLRGERVVHKSTITNKYGIKIIFGAGFTDKRTKFANTHYSSAFQLGMLLSQEVYFPKTSSGEERKVAVGPLGAAFCFS